MDLRLTLQYLGVPLREVSYLFRDNKAVVDSSTIPHSKIHKWHMALSFHWVQEAMASGMLYFGFIDGSINPADILSKHWGYQQVKEMIQHLLLRACPTRPSRQEGSDKIPSKW